MFSSLDARLWSGVIESGSSAFRQIDYIASRRAAFDRRVVIGQSHRGRLPRRERDVTIRPRAGGERWVAIDREPLLERLSLVSVTPLAGQTLQFTKAVPWLRIIAQLCRLFI